jgi:hypothetical protein
MGETYLEYAPKLVGSQCLLVYVASDRLRIYRGTNTRSSTLCSRITSPRSRSGRDSDLKSSGECHRPHG